MLTCSNPNNELFGLAKGRRLAGDFQYGGQAIIEGVMIRGKKAITSAVRCPDGEIIVHTESPKSLVQTYRWLRFPFLRGAPALIDALRIGYRALTYSANVAMEAEGEKPPSQLYYIVSFAGAFVLGIGLFVVLPNLLLQPLHRQHSITKNLLEGLVKLAFFIGYVLMISRWEHVKRIFRYHGAEHMVINAFERGREISVESAKEYDTVHVRCGSSFVMLVLFVAIVVHCLVGWPKWYYAIPLRILLLIPIAGISYEIMKLAASPRASWLIHIITAPGLWLQRLTTGKPSDDQIEVAIAALNGVLKAEAEMAESADSVAAEKS